MAVGVEPSTFKLKVHLREEVDREAFFTRCWAELGGEAGLLGVHEGTVLSAEAAQEGMETESWTLDAAEAPRERDWIGGRLDADAELFFATRSDAERARAFLLVWGAEVPGEVIEQLPEDWDAQWKKSFRGINVPPHWKVIPPWVSPEEFPGSGRVLRINPGAGFGTGTHETTQLCLELLSTHAQAYPLRGQCVLDFGSGSGILAIAAAMSQAAHIHAVEIDPLAIDNATENARLNEIGGELTLSSHLPVRSSAAQFSLILANILRPVLVECAPELVSRLKAGGAVILSGLIETDVPEVVKVYSALLGRPPARVISKEEWRAIYWSPAETT